MHINYYHMATILTTYRQLTSDNYCSDTRYTNSNIITSRCQTRVKRQNRHSGSLGQALRVISNFECSVPIKIKCTKYYQISYNASVRKPPLHLCTDQIKPSIFQIVNWTPIDNSCYYWLILLTISCKWFATGLQHACENFWLVWTVCRVAIW